ncbi:hypothetical protein [Streptomyces sp. NPDC052291]|uniref:hypothetical protein n=1 Tax=Streptomyces TaxID=1883 RepID=UPI003432CC84
MALARLPLEAHRVVAAAVDGDACFSDVGALEIAATCGVGAAPVARATLDAATTERTLLRERVPLARVAAEAVQGGEGPAARAGVGARPGFPPPGR